MIATLVVITWMLGAALFWYTDIERATRRLAQEGLAIRFEAHLMVAKRSCGVEPLTIEKPTGTIVCRPISSNRAEVEILLTTGQKHQEVINFDE